MPTTDIQVSNLKINVLTEEQYEQIQNPSNTELYLVPEVVDTVPTEDSTNTITSGAVYNAIHNITAADVNAIPITEKDANNGVATLNSSGKIPSHQLPSYVDDVLEYGSFNDFPATGENGKIYIALDTNKTYRWSGSAYVEISESLALGETSSTAYRGDRGKTAYDHSQVTDGSNPHNTTFANIASKPTTISGYGITDAFSGNYNDLTNKPTIPAAGIPSGGNAGQVLKKASATDYDVHWVNDSETLPSAYCTTSGNTAAKKANCSLYVTQTNQYLQVLIGSANTYQGALTLNINSAGAKPIYINGTVSSSSNYTLPNGTYFVFYDGTNYYFRTDGKLPMKDTAFGGSYNDLADKPTIPAAQVNSDWNASSGVAQILNKPTIPSITLITWTNS